MSWSSSPHRSTCPCACLLCFVVMCIVLAPLLVPRFPVYVYMCLGVCVRVCLEYRFISVRRFPVLKPATTAVHQASLAATDRHC